MRPVPTIAHVGCRTCDERAAAFGRSRQLRAGSRCASIQETEPISSLPGHSFAQSYGPHQEQKLHGVLMQHDEWRRTAVVPSTPLEATLAHSQDGRPHRKASVWRRHVRLPINLEGHIATITNRSNYLPILGDCLTNLGLSFMQVSPSSLHARLHRRNAH